MGLTLSWWRSLSYQDTCINFPYLVENNYIAISSSYAKKPQYFIPDCSLACAASKIAVASVALGVTHFTTGNIFSISSSVNGGCFLFIKSYSRRRIWSPVFLQNSRSMLNFWRFFFPIKSSRLELEK